MWIKNAEGSVGIDRPVMRQSCAFPIRRRKRLCGANERCTIGELAASSAPGRRGYAKFVQVRTWMCASMSPDRSKVIERLPGARHPIRNWATRGFAEPALWTDGSFRSAQAGDDRNFFPIPAGEIAAVFLSRMRATSRITAQPHIIAACELRLQGGQFVMRREKVVAGSESSSRSGGGRGE